MQVHQENILSLRVYLRAVIPAVCAIGVLWIFAEKLAGVDIAQGLRDVSAFGAQSWCLAFLFTWISFAAVARYDPIINDALKHDIPRKRALSMSWKATAISQLAGFGLVTGTLVRWLELGLNPSRPAHSTGLMAFKTTLSVTGAFLVAWAIVTAIAAAVSFLPLLQWISLSLALIFSTIVLPQTRWTWPKTLRNHWRRTVSFIVLTFIDTLFAALVIYTFLPDGLLAFPTLYLSFLLAYAVGLISGLPGGMGPFEVCIVTLLPSLELTQLAPALIGFRLVYFAGPAVLAMALLARQHRHRSASTGALKTSDKVPMDLLRFAPPQHDLLTDRRLECFHSLDKRTASLVQQTNRAIVQLGDVFGPKNSAVDFFAIMQNSARWSKRSFCIYRCDRSTALQSKRLGMASVKVSSEAILRPSEFSLASSTRSSLRRKLRKAAKAKIRINSRPATMEDLVDLNSAWSGEHTTARGFSTGLFSTELVGKQRIYVAYQDDEAVAFISLSMSPNGWLLDLIRYRAKCPDGTIYALVTQAIEDAYLAGIAEVSLGSVPFCPPLHGTRISGWIWKQIFKRSSGLKGLYQFKSCFAPEWHDRYFVASNGVDGVVGIVTLCQSIFSSSPQKRHSA